MNVSVKYAIFKEFQQFHRLVFITIHYYYRKFTCVHVWYEHIIEAIVHHENIPI